MIRRTTKTFARIGGTLCLLGMLSGCVGYDGYGYDGYGGYGGGGYYGGYDTGWGGGWGGGWGPGYGVGPYRGHGPGGGRGPGGHGPGGGGPGGGGSSRQRRRSGWRGWPWWRSRRRRWPRWGRRPSLTPALLSEHEAQTGETEFRLPHPVFRKRRDPRVRPVPEPRSRP
ncbi:hypothetical protein [Gluconobacter aidae]|uniref:hypothetical protein n=1 Tax=Gluconobacter aidae TaxID=2662454 RepID=UPI001885EC61|nr:hypothetical protein [Gluconobacter aidae]